MKTYRPSVLIIGGGASGLAAAATLTKKEYNVTLLEASNRIGGRIWTHFPEGQTFPIELGPEFVHGEAPTTHKYLGESVKKLKQKQLYFDKAKLEELENFAEILDKGFEKIDNFEPDFAIAQILSKVSTKTKETKAFAGFVEGFFAADVNELSKISIADSEGSDFASNSKAVNGYVELLNVLRAQINPKFYTELLNSPVHRIEWKENYVNATTNNIVIEAEAAILALPIENLKKLEFSPEITETKRAAEFIDGGAVIKPIVTFTEPLWKLGSEDQQQIISPSLNFPARWVWKDAPQFQMSNWAGGAHANAIVNEPEDVLLDLVLQDVSVITGIDPQSLKSRVDNMYFHNWMKDPWALGAYSYVKVGGKNAREILARPVKKTLFFAGEVTATDGTDGTVEGALNQGLRAAKEVISHRKRVETLHGVLAKDFLL